jgi:hypothetical protein
LAARGLLLLLLDGLLELLNLLAKGADLIGQLSDLRAQILHGRTTRRGKPAAICKAPSARTASWPAASSAPSATWSAEIAATRWAATGSCLISRSAGTALGSVLIHCRRIARARPSRRLHLPAGGGKASPTQKHRSSQRRQDARGSLTHKTSNIRRTGTLRSN